MATITLTVPNAVAARINTMLRDQYAPMITTETDGEVFKLVLRYWLKRRLADYEGGIAHVTAQGSVDTAVANQTTARAAAVTNAENAAETIT